MYNKHAHGNVISLQVKIAVEIADSKEMWIDGPHRYVV